MCNNQSVLLSRRTALQFSAKLDSQTPTEAMLHSRLLLLHYAPVGNYQQFRTLSYKTKIPVNSSSKD